MTENQPALVEQPATKAAATNQPSRQKPTPARAVKLTAQRAAQNPAPPAKTNKQTPDKQTQPQNLELFPPEATDAPKNQSSKLDIAVSVDRSKKKKK